MPVAGITRSSAYTAKLIESLKRKTRFCWQVKIRLTVDCFIVIHRKEQFKKKNGNSGAFNVKKIIFERNRDLIDEFAINYSAIFLVDLEQVITHGNLIKKNK